MHWSSILHHLVMGVSLLALLGTFVGFGRTPTIQAASFTVTKTADTNDGVCDTDCSLREAIIAANTAPGADSISIPSGTYALSRPGSDDTAISGDLDLTGPVTLNGAGATQTIIDGLNNQRVFHITGAYSVTVSSLTIQGGGNQSTGGGVYNNGGALTIVDSVLMSNTASSPGNGGAIYMNGGLLTLASTTLRNNSASNNGGAIQVTGIATLTITASTFSNNSAKNGGALYINAGAVSITNSTFSANSATNGTGGGIRNYANLTLTNVTFSDNSATSGGGALRTSGTATVKNTILANSPLGSNCNGTFTSQGGNLSSDTSCANSLTGAGDQNNANPLLGSLQNNGGPTFTYALSAGSPAINAGNNSGCPSTDQRGSPRDALCDIGAYESTTVTPVPTATNTPQPTDTPTPIFTPTSTPIPVNTPTLAPTGTATSIPNNTPTPIFTSSPTPTVTVSFAVIGDYGLAGQPEADVAALVHSWNPDFILTVGDNNYPSGEASTIDANIGQYYHDYIYPYGGNYGPGSLTNRFWPAPGNHDWYSTTGIQPYLNYFTLPGNERYYDIVIGPIHFFLLDSDFNEPDGRTSTSVQAQWLQGQLTTSTAPWQIVLLHHPPYSSGAEHGSDPNVQWPYAAWGADAVIAGHDHDYERIFQNGIVYFVNGLGGNGSHQSFGPPIPGSQVRYSNDFGAMLVQADSAQVTFQFINRANVVIDTYTIPSGVSPTATPTPITTATPTATPLPGGNIFTVTKLNDTNDGACNSDCSLREALIAANALPGPDTISLPAGTYLITRTNSDDTANGGDLDITDSLTLTGAGASNTFIDGNAQYRVFHVVNAVSVTFSDVTLRNGGNVNTGAGLYNNGGALTIINSVIGDNAVSATGNGGGIYMNGGTLILSNSTMNNNNAGNNGGALYLTATVNVTLNGSTLNNNTAKNGAAIYVNSGSASLSNSTLSNNSAINGSGGGIRNYGAVTLLNVTLANNFATSSGGGLRNTGTAVLKNTLLGNSSSGGNCSGTLTSQGHNLSSDASCAASFFGVGDLNNINPILGPLQNNGGPTWTHALLAGSPAINAGDNNGCPTLDQRSVAREAQCDIGAYEFVGASPTPTATSTGTPTNTPTPTITSTAVPTATPTLLVTDTATPIPTETPAPLATDTPAPLPTETPTPWVTDTVTPLPTETASATPTPLPSDLLFADDFESGNLAAWSSSATGNGDLSAGSEAALVGLQGLRAFINDTTSLYVQDNTPASETRYRARFYFDPNSIVMAANDSHIIFQGLSASGSAVFQFNFRYVSGVYQVQVQTRNDNATWTNLAAYTLTDAPHFIEMDWQAATSTGSNNGFFTLWIDGQLKESKTNLDNDAQRIDQVKLGPLYGLDAGTVGAEYFDAFESRRTTYIGPVGG